MHFVIRDSSNQGNAEDMQRKHQAADNLTDNEGCNRAANAVSCTPCKINCSTLSFT